MAYRRADVEETALYAKKFVRYEEGAKKYSRELSWITWLSIQCIIIGGRYLQSFLERVVGSESV